MLLVHYIYFDEIQFRPNIACLIIQKHWKAEKSRIPVLFRIQKPNSIVKKPNLIAKKHWKTEKIQIPVLFRDSKSNAIAKKHWKTEKFQIPVLFRDSKTKPDSEKALESGKIPNSSTFQKRRFTIAKPKLLLPSNH